MKLLLLGYRACGKTSAGKGLASSLGVDFVDTDRLIEERAGKSVAEIVAESGWPGFRAMEREVLSEVIHADGDAVVSCGGGAVLHGDLLETLPPGVWAAWLQASVQSIVKRIGQDSRSASLRPSLTGNDDLRAEVEAVLDERLPLYEKYSNFVISTDDADLDTVISRLRELWNQLESGQSE